MPWLPWQSLQDGAASVRPDLSSPWPWTLDLNPSRTSSWHLPQVLIWPTDAMRDSESSMEPTACGGPWQVLQLFPACTLLASCFVATPWQPAQIAPASSFCSGASLSCGVLVMLT